MSLSDGSKPVKLANQCTQEYLSGILQGAGPSPNNFECGFYLAANLSENLRSQIWNIFEENMQSLYIDSSTGWVPSDKRTELFHVLARYILLTPAGNPDEIVCYSTFRFEHEDGEDLLYCYELQVDRAHQHKGFGRFLIGTLETIGRKMLMEKVMLTVLAANKAALEFYKAIGYYAHHFCLSASVFDISIRFQLDPCSPTYHDGDEEGAENDKDIDYQILSKSLT
ncbi:hypothetical protein D9757_002867 [Collybiopsis confluens]|uniref:N-alpha-acetyltransferase 40 n=1 Tax=Collybiopsis confluens TaxID=2823264 RepID=A0A8H5MD82_9AGAR|nr:hypothetical protein D9757_002867 [Collybiopsis confluens]